MKLFTRLSLLSLFSLALLPLAQAGEVGNVRVETTDDHVNFFWDHLPTDDFTDADGYAVQFSERQTDVKITVPANLYLSRGETSVELRRNSFGNGTYNYLRIYSYYLDDENQKILGNGSDLIKWRTDFWNRVETTTTEVNDPVVTTSSSSSSTNKDDLFEVGQVRIMPYDTFVHFGWSKPVLMATSDYDGFMLKISKESDLENPVLEKTLDRDETKASVRGLDPATNYYATLFFYDEAGSSKQTFGNKTIDTFKTITAIPRDGSTRASRNIVKIERRVHGKVIALDGSSTTTTSSTSSTTTSTSSSSSNTDIRARIAALKSQISSLQSELRTLEAKIGVRSSTSVSTSTRTSTSGSSKLSKLRALLEARRNSK